MARNMYHPEELPVPDPEQQAALVQAWAGLLGRRDVLVLDTETTSLDRPEVIDLGIIDTRGYRRMDRLVLPKYGIELGAQRVHGISIEHLSERQAPTFDAVATRLQRLLDEAAVICIYNSGFDLAALKTSAECAGVSGDWVREAGKKARCIMDDYAYLVGRWHDYWQDWQWHKLTVAAGREGVPLRNAHRAVWDCKMTLGIMRAVVARGRAA